MSEFFVDFIAVVCEVGKVVSHNFRWVG
jgi:hypothetical protein